MRVVKLKMAVDNRIATIPVVVIITIIIIIIINLVSTNFLIGSQVHFSFVR
jgi:hypothetical protein